MKPKLTTQFEQYIQYCKYTRGLRPKTIGSYEDVFRHFCKLMPDISFADDLNPEVMDAFFMRLQTRTRRLKNGEPVQGIRASTARTYGNKLSAFFHWLCVRGHLDDNPVKKEMLAQPIYNDIRALDRKEVERIISAITQHSDNRFLQKRNLAIVAVLLFTGVRKSELLALKLSDIDFSRKIIVVRGETSKSKVTRRVPITNSVLWPLEDYLTERRTQRTQSEWLWLSNGASKRFTEHGLKHWVEAMVEKSGVKFHVHRFRHTFACMLGRKNVSAVKIQKLLGHADLRMTQVYLRSLGVEDLRDSVSSLSIESL